MMLPKQVVTHKELLKEGMSKEEIANLNAGLKLFPTPFKGIYYVPMEQERKGNFIQKPLKVLSRAIELFLGNGDFYYSCDTAEEFWGIKWNPSNSIHVVNGKLSRRINLGKRIEANRKKNTYRSGRVANLLSLYGDEIIFHKSSDIMTRKIKHTPTGRFAMRDQIKKDRKKFGCF